MWKVYPLVIIQKGYLLCKKIIIKKGMGLGLGVELFPGIRLGWLSTLSPWLPYKAVDSLIF